MTRAVVIAVLALHVATACTGDTGSSWGPESVRYTAIELATKPGLSGLAADEDGSIWTVSERGREAYRIRLSQDLVASIEPYAITGVPDQTDIEAMEGLGDGRFAF